MGRDLYIGRPHEYDEEGFCHNEPQNDGSELQKAARIYGGGDDVDYRHVYEDAQQVIEKIQELSQEIQDLQLPEEKEEIVGSGVDAMKNDDIYLSAKQLMMEQYMSRLKSLSQALIVYGFVVSRNQYPVEVAYC